MSVSVTGRAVRTLDDALAGSLGVEGLAELAHNPLPYGLAVLLAQCLPGRGKRARVELLRTKYKPGRKLTAYYRLYVGAEVRPIALSWCAEPQSENANATDLGDDARHRRLLAPFAQLSARTASARTVLLVAPFDPQLPQLTRLNDPAYVSGLLRDLTSDPNPWPSPASVGAVRYRPGQRHVLQVSPAPDRDGPGLFIKIDRDDCGARAVRFVESVGPRLTELCPTIGLVPPLGYSAPDRASVWRRVPGHSLSEEVRDPARAASLLARLGSAVRTLHDLDRPTDGTPAAQWPQHLARSELAATLRAGEHLAALAPAVGARYRSLATEVLERLEDVPEEAPRLSHGDLKCDNLLAAGERLWLLDFDRSGRADPALDVAKLLADLRWWGDHHSVVAAPLIRGFLDGYGPCDSARLSRAGLLAVLYQLKLAARRIPVHRLDWAAQVTRHVEAAAATLRQECVP